MVKKLDKRGAMVDDLYTMMPMGTQPGHSDADQWMIDRQL